MRKTAAHSLFPISARSVRRQPEPPPRKPPHCSPSRFRRASKWSAANRSPPDSARDQILWCTLRTPTALLPRGNGRAPAAVAQTSRSRQSMSATICRKKFQPRAPSHQEPPCPRPCAPSRSPALEQLPQAQALALPASRKYQARCSVPASSSAKVKLIATVKVTAKSLANFVPAQSKPARRAPTKLLAQKKSRSTQFPQASRSARIGPGAAAETPRCPLSTFGPPSRLPCRSFPRERKPQAPVGSNRSLSASLCQPVKVKKLDAALPKMVTARSLIRHTLRHSSVPARLLARSRRAVRRAMRATANLVPQRAREIH
jgi:hypothetical protein